MADRPQLGEYTVAVTTTAAADFKGFTWTGYASNLSEALDNALNAWEATFEDDGQAGPQSET